MHIVVTGASSGIGLALARAFAADGTRMSLVARRVQVIEELRKELRGETQALQADLSAPGDPVGWLRRAEERFGPTDLLINNAGASYMEPIEGITDAQSRSLFQLNTLTPMAAIHHVLPAMLSRRAGTIVNVTSCAAFLPAPYLCHYNGTKAALANFSESLRIELNLKKSGVTVVTVYPGPIATPMGDRNWAQIEATLLTRLAMPTGDTATLSRLVVRAVQRRKARVIYPRFFLFNWWFPFLARWATERFAPPATGKKTPPLPGDLL